MVLFLWSCETKDKRVEDIPESAPKPEVSIVRLDVILHKLILNGKALHEDSIRIAMYPHRKFIREWIFAGDSLLCDSIYPKMFYSFCRDPKVAELLDSVLLHFPENYPFDSVFTPPLRRLAYYFPDEKIPEIYIYITGFQPNIGLNEQSYLSDDFAGISLDYFLGESFSFYPSDIPRYLRRRCRPEYLPVALMANFATYLHQEPRLHTSPMLLDYVIAYGMRNMFMEYVLPDVQDSIRLSYSSQQMAFVQAYEEKVYKELIPLLYTTDYMKYEKYISDKPFTPNLSEESADRLASFLGWRIMKSYRMKHPEIPFPVLMKNYNHKRIFEDARYKPKG